MPGPTEMVFQIPALIRLFLRRLGADGIAPGENSPSRPDFSPLTRS